MQPRLRALSIQKGWTTSMHSSLERGLKNVARDAQRYLQRELELEKVKTVCELAFSG